MKRIITMAILAVSCQMALAQKVTVDLSSTGPELSPYMYGIFYEDINYAADGGLNSQLVQNASFEYFQFYTSNSPEPVNFHPLYAWETISEEGGEGMVYVSGTQPLNENNPKNLEILQNEAKGFFGVTNLGFDGMVLKAGEKYDLSFYASFRTENNFMRRGQQPPVKIIKVLLTDAQGKVLDSVEWSGEKLVRDWTKFEHTFTSPVSVSDARLSILVHGKCLTKLDMVSLKPQNTFNGHGLRTDLVQTIKDMAPSFMRFPGGCIVHGGDMENTYHWKKTVGDPAQRRNIWSRWGYFQSMALGYYEYFVLCEDLGAIPLPVLPVGVSCGFEKYEVLPMDQLGEPIQDMLDLVEFANGPVDSPWGSVRAQMGHPEPFGLEYVCLGNEEDDTPEFRERYPYFVKALREKYPEIKIVGTSGFGARVPLHDLMEEQKVWSTDEHYYMQPEWFVSQQNRFDSYDRNGPKIFVGEYASLGNKLLNAVSEAAFMTGLERNADVVEMASYAPLLAKYGHTQWRANMIYFDNLNIVHTPNYYVQKMFSLNRGDVYVNHKKSSFKDDKVAVSTTLDREAGELVIKLVNASDEDRKVSFSVKGAANCSSSASSILLTGDPQAENTLDNPDNVAPVTREIRSGKNFSAEAPAWSVQIIRLSINQ